jgi:hypothetical protein
MAPWFGRGSTRSGSPRSGPQHRSAPMCATLRCAHSGRSGEPVSTSEARCEDKRCARVDPSEPLRACLSRPEPLRPGVQRFGIRILPGSDYGEIFVLPWRSHPVIVIRRGLGYCAT